MVTPAAALGMVAVLAVALVVFRLGAAVVARHQAQSAADLGALAAAALASGSAEAACAAARAVAKQMDATVRNCVISDLDATITISVNGMAGTAIAAARAGPEEVK